MQAAQRSVFTLHPLALLAAGLAAGIVAAQLLPISLFVLSGCEVLFGSSLIWSLRKRLYSAASVCLIFMSFFAGAALTASEERSAPSNGIKQQFAAGAIVSGDPVELTGTIADPPQVAAESLYLKLRVERIRCKNLERSASGVVELLAPTRDRLVHAEYDALELRYGARIRVMTQLERADNYRNQGVSSFTEYLERKGYDATGVIKSPLLVERLDDKAIFLPLAWLYDWHEKLEAEIKRSFSSETAGVLDAALLGNRYNLSHETAERFRQGGTFHVLVINGLHISFIGFVVLLIVRRFIKKRSGQFIVSTIVLWSYAVAVGAQSAVVRASDARRQSVTTSPAAGRQARQSPARKGRSTETMDRRVRSDATPAGRARPRPARSMNSPAATAAAPMPRR